MSGIVVLLGLAVPALARADDPALDITASAPGLTSPVVVQFHAPTAIPAPTGTGAARTTTSYRVELIGAPSGGASCQPIAIQSTTGAVAKGALVRQTFAPGTSGFCRTNYTVRVFRVSEKGGTTTFLSHYTTQPVLVLDETNAPPPPTTTHVPAGYGPTSIADAQITSTPGPTSPSTRLIYSFHAPHNASYAPIGETAGGSQVQNEGPKDGWGFRYEYDVERVASTGSIPNCILSSGGGTILAYVIPGHPEADVIAAGDVVPLDISPHGNPWCPGTWRVTATLVQRPEGAEPKTVATYPSTTFTVPAPATPVPTPAPAPAPAPTPAPAAPKPSRPTVTSRKPTRHGHRVRLVLRRTVGASRRHSYAVAMTDTKGRLVATGSVRGRILTVTLTHRRERVHHRSVVHYASIARRHLYTLRSRGGGRRITTTSVRVG